MIPTSISASALEIAQDCMAKWEAHYNKKGTTFQNDAAKLGTTLHEALQAWVTQERISAQDWSWGMLLILFKMAFYRNFSVIDMDENEWYKQGEEILKHWYNRSGQLAELSNTVIISKEVKDEFKMPYVLNGQKMYVPFRYIMDRLDDLGDGVYRVVDYKSQRAPVSADEMLRKIQPRAYALAVQIAYPKATRVWVQYDFLRYSSTSVAFDKDDNRRTWQYIRNLTQRIVDTKEGEAERTLGPGCQYCLARITCPAALSNASAGGILGLEVEELADLYGKIQAQIGAQKAIAEEIEQRLIRHAREEDTQEYRAGSWEVSVKVGSRRYVDNEKLSEIVGPKIMAKYGKVNVGDLDAIKKEPDLTDEQRSLLSGTVFKKPNDASVRIKPYVEV